MREKYRPYNTTELDLAEDWFLNDEAVDKFYLDLESHEITALQLPKLYDDLESELARLLSNDTHNSKEIDRIERLSNLTKVLHKKIHGYKDKNNNSEIDSDGVINLGETLH